MFDQPIRFWFVCLPDLTLAISTANVWNTFCVLISSPLFQKWSQYQWASSHTPNTQSNKFMKCWKLEDVTSCKAILDCQVSNFLLALNHQFQVMVGTMLLLCCSKWILISIICNEYCSWFSCASCLLSWNDTYCDRPILPTYNWGNLYLLSYVSDATTTSGNESLLEQNDAKPSMVPATMTAVAMSTVPLDAKLPQCHFNLCNSWALAYYMVSQLQ